MFKYHCVQSLSPKQVGDRDNYLVLFISLFFAERLFVLIYDNTSWRAVNEIL